MTEKFIEGSARRAYVGMGRRFAFEWANRRQSGAARGAKMQQTSEFEDTYEVVDVPVSAILKPLRKKGYGSVPGLDDEELADPVELEKQVIRDELAPILALPVKGQRSSIRPVIDESFGVDWGAFSTVDFDRYRPELDKARYKAAKLREELKDLSIRIGIVRERLPGKAKYLVFKYLQKGIIELAHIDNMDMLILARLWLRAEGLRQEIYQLEKASWKRSQRQLEQFLEV